MATENVLVELCQNSIQILKWVYLELFKNEKPYRINDIELESENNVWIHKYSIWDQAAIFHNLRDQQEQLDVDNCGFLKDTKFSARNTHLVLKTSPW